MVGNLNELQVSQCLCQGIKPLWNQRGWAAEQLVRDVILPAEEKLGSALVIRYRPSLSYFTVCCWQCPRLDGLLPHRPCTSSIFKDNLDILEAWGASKLSDTVLSSGLLPWSSHGSAQMSVLTCMCLRRSLPDQRT